MRSVLLILNSSEKRRKAATVDAALPGSNVITRNHASARHAFREAVFDVLHDKVVDEGRSPHPFAQDTYEALLAFKPQGRGRILSIRSRGLR